MIKKNNWFLLAVILVYLTWSAVYIYRMSYIALDGQRYFSLGDDAFISMRYAWNLSHGDGLVWNAGEYVEGYTNLLMTLVMALATGLFEKKLAALVIQLLGVPTVLAIAFLTRRLAQRLYAASPWLADLAFAGTLLYFPLSFWPLIGMETGLLTLLTLAGLLLAVEWRANRQPRTLGWMAVCLGLAFLTRNDGLIFAPLVFALVFLAWWPKKDRAELRAILAAGLLLGLFVVAQEVFRLWYYGELLPNTYTLKVSGVPLSLKLRWGWKFVAPFFPQAVFCLALAVFELVRGRGKNLLLGFFLALALAYQVWVGGDAWPEWRILQPAMPLLFILAAAGSLALARWLAERLGGAAVQRAGGLALVIILLNAWFLNLPFRSYFDFSTDDVQAFHNAHNTNLALAIQAVTGPEATLGVFWAGALPYYADRRAIDFLGKSDKYIASLPAHLYMPIPGHNKFDLAYSIRKLQPTYIQDFEWAKENLRPWVVQHYQRLNYVTPQGDITLILKTSDPAVDWSRGTLLPWASVEP